MTLHKTGIQMGEITRTRRLVELVTQVVQSDSFYRRSKTFAVVTFWNI